jgi:hypothetical protein
MMLLGWVAALIVIAGSAVAVLVRRDRRRSAASAEGHRIERVATRGALEARRDTRMVREWSGASVISSVRDRDS